MVTSSTARPRVYAVATMDTKREEILYVAECIRAAGAPVTVVNVGTQDSSELGADIGRETVAASHSCGKDAVLGLIDRGQAIAAMSEALTEFLRREHSAGRISAVIGIGGGGGTSLITFAMRALPIGVPKIMVSTLASSDVAQFVGCSDITMMPSVVDIAGINSISSKVLANAAHAVVGMATIRGDHPGPIAHGVSGRRAVAMTMFGVTTPCVETVRKLLQEEGEECLVFHATGMGGRSMEKLVEGGFIGAVLDITTTEVADEVVGGILSAGPERFDRILARGIPYVMSLGALDMVNFAGMRSVPKKFLNRKLHVHNSEATLMRTTPEENRLIARWIADKLNRTPTAVTLLIPECGVSALDAPGQPFYDPLADSALFEELEKTVRKDSACQIRRLPLHINDPAFAREICAEYARLNEHSRSI